MIIRNCTRILLINAKNELLLIADDDTRCTFKDGKYRGKCWYPVGGKVEEGEDFIDATYRELQEETSLTKDQVELGPIVWHQEFEMILDDKSSLFKQHYIVMRTKNNQVSPSNLSEREKETFRGLKWFSLDEIKNSGEIIYPADLIKLLPDVIKKNYPKAIIQLGEMKSVEILA